VLNMSSSHAHFVVKDSTESDKSQTNPRNSLCEHSTAKFLGKQAQERRHLVQHKEVDCCSTHQQLSHDSTERERERDTHTHTHTHRKTHRENSWMSTGILRRWITHRVDPELHANTHQRVSKFCATARGRHASSSP
jgi:hypothetical protein